MSMPRSSRRKSGAALLAACLFLEGAFHPAAVLFAQAVKEPVVAAALSVAPAGSVDSKVIPAGPALGAGPEFSAPPPAGLQNPGLAASPAGAPSKDSRLRFLGSLRRDLGRLDPGKPEDFTDSLVGMLGPGADGTFPAPRKMASALTIAEAFTHPETLPVLLPRLERMDDSWKGEWTARLLLLGAREFLWGSAADADSARRRLDEAVRNIPGLRAQARARLGAARILDSLFDGRLASLGEAPAQAVGRPAGGVDGRTPKPNPLSLSHAAARLRRAMKFGFEPTFTNKRMEELYQAGGAEYSNYLNEKSIRLLKELRMELKPTRKSDEWSFYDRVGRWDVGTDVGVIELQPPPQKFKTILPQMTALFRASQKAGLAPEIAFGGIYGGGGHIHLDKKIFEDNPLLLRNFVVDVHNRPYIQAVLEELGEDTAQSIRQKGDELLFRTAIAGIDGEWKRTGGRLGWKKTLEYLKPLFGLTRYRDINLENLVKEQYPPTVEIRMHRAQRAPEDFRDLAEFWLYRLANLSLSKEPIPLLDPDKDAVKRMKLPSVAVHLWRKLVRESGLPRPERYERFAREKFPSPLRLGPSRKPRMEIRYAGNDEDDEDIYEVLVKNPDIRKIRIGRAFILKLSKARELPGRPRIGSFVASEQTPDVMDIEGVPGIKSVDLSQARKELESYRVSRWRKVR